MPKYWINLKPLHNLIRKVRIHTECIFRLQYSLVNSYPDNSDIHLVRIWFQIQYEENNALRSS